MIYTQYLKVAYIYVIQVLTYPKTKKKINVYSKFYVNLDDKITYIFFIAMGTTSTSFFLSFHNTSILIY